MTPHAQCPVCGRSVAVSRFGGVTRLNAHVTGKRHTRHPRHSPPCAGSGHVIIPVEQVSA